MMNPACIEGEADCMGRRVSSVAWETQCTFAAPEVRLVPKVWRGRGEIYQIDEATKEEPERLAARASEFVGSDRYFIAVCIARGAA